jgi:LacI family transcriptional regulator
MPANKKPTLKDIAEKLNITVATVSRALRNHPDISQKIKDQVKLIAESLHYRPNSFAVNLRKQSSGLIGIMLPKIVHYYSSTMIKGMVGEAQKHNYQIMICESGINEETEKENAWALLNSGVDGLLVSVSNNTFNETYFQDIQQEGYPIVFFDKVPISIPCNKISTDDFKGGYLATEHLIQQGYKKIAHFKGQAGARNTIPRLHGYLKALQDYSIQVNEQFIIDSIECREEEGYHKTLFLMQQKKKPDAIFCENDEMAIGTIAALRYLNVNIPHDFGVVGFCNMPVGNYMQPTLTSIAQSGDEIGAKAMAMLIDIIKNPGKLNDNISLVTEPSLIIRNSSLRLNHH